MLGKFQQTHLRIEINAPATVIRECLMRPSLAEQWLWPQTFGPGLPEEFEKGLSFSSSIGPIVINHFVDVADGNCFRCLLSKGIDGYHEWYWGDGWIQSRLEGVSLLPLNLSQTVNLLRFRQFVASRIQQQQHREQT